MNKPIKCPGCQTLFGVESDNILNIKHRDLFRWIKGEIWGPCRRCGTMIKWSSNEDKRS